jgi:septal ring factor EnvC (AmiA/AmiB activator)
MFIKKFAEIRDVIEQGYSATNEKINTVANADTLCRANLGGITKERIQVLETHNEHNGEAIKTMQETTTKLGKDISSIQTGLNKLEKDMIKLETGLKALQETQNNMMALLSKIHGETAAKTNALKKAIGGNKTKGVISKETYKG